jgi:hypothetical protein
MRNLVKSHKPLTHIKPFGFSIETKTSQPSLNETIISSLANKVKTHNSAMRSQQKPNWSMVTLEKLKTVYGRGIAAHSDSRPKSVPSSQWGMARVNAFLRILKSGKPTNKKYVEDNDLLHEDHPWSKRGIRKKSIFYRSETFSADSWLETKASLRSISNLASSIGRRGRGLEGRGFRRSNYRRFARFDIRAQDADGDGKVQDGTNQERPVAVYAEPQIKKLFDRLKDPDGGFTFSVNDFDDVKSGWAISKKGNGIKLKFSDVFDDNGEIKEDAIDRLEALLDVNADQILRNKPNSTKKVTLGGWHNPKDGHIYFDITEVHDKNSMSKEKALQEGRKQNQIAIIDLDNLHEAFADDNWDREIFHNSGGNGENLIDSPGKKNEPLRIKYESALKQARDRGQVRRGATVINPNRMEVADDGTTGPPGEVGWAKRRRERQRREKRRYLKGVQQLAAKPDLTTDEMIELMRLTVSRKSDRNALAAHQKAAAQAVLDRDYIHGLTEIWDNNNFGNGEGLVNLYLRSTNDSEKSTIITFLKFNKFREFFDLPTSTRILKDGDNEETIDTYDVDPIDLYTDDELYDIVKNKAAELVSSGEEQILPKEVKRLYRLETSPRLLMGDDADYDNDIFKLKVGDVFSDDGMVTGTSTAEDALLNGLVIQKGTELTNFLGDMFFDGTDVDRALRTFAESPEFDHAFIEIKIPDSVRESNPVVVGSKRMGDWILPTGGQFQVRRINTLETRTSDGKPVLVKRIVVDWIGKSELGKIMSGDSNEE